MTSSRVQLISGYSPAGYKEYGKRFLSTFDRYWPDRVQLAVYVEEYEKIPDRIQQRILWSIPDIREFIEQESADPQCCGRVPMPGWRKKEIEAGYSWKHDAVRFCRQLFIPSHALSCLDDGDIFAWIDADVVTFADVPEDLIERLLGENDLVHLGRERGSTELGFWAVRVNTPTRAFTWKLANSCRSREIYKLQEWHSGFVFDYYLDWCRRTGGLRAKSLTSDSGHVWFDTELGQYTDHLKGDARKRWGISQERIVAARRRAGM